MTPHTGQAPVLLCPDILVEIFNHLQPGRRTLEETNVTRKQRLLCRQSLLASALTCRTLSDLALDVLWRALDDIRPLLKLLPGYQRTFVLKPHITPGTWAKFRSYATRVREIGLSPDLRRVHPSIWTFLAIKCEGSPLLPHLQCLDAYEISLDDLSPLFLLLAPSLRSLSLDIDDNRSKTKSQVIVLVLQHIAQVAPRIKTFHVLGRCFSGMEHLTMLQNFGLAELSLDPHFVLTGPMLSQLSATTSLNTLTATIGHLTPSDLQSLGDNFQSLCSVTLRARLDDLVNLILACRLPLLNALTLQMNDCKDPMELTSGLTSICQRLDLAKSLTHVGLEFRSDIGGRPTQTLIQYLEPLLSLPKVVSCDLIFHRAPPSVSDGDLIRLGDAWPNLQRLNVRTHMMGYTWQNRVRGGYGDWARNTVPDIQHPTVCGLTELARRCPALQYIHLVTLDAALVRTPPRGSAAPSPLAHPRLRELLVEHIPSTKARSMGRCAIAEALDAAFPGLDISLSKAECASPNVRGSEWRRIMLLMRGLRYGRHPHLAPGAHARMAAGARFAASMSLEALDEALSDAEDEDSDREWDLDSDSDGDWLSSCEEYSSEGLDSAEDDG